MQQCLLLGFIVGDYELNFYHLSWLSDVEMTKDIMVLSSHAKKHSNMKI